MARATISATLTGAGGLALAVAAFSSFATVASAQEILPNPGDEVRMEIWDLRLGTPVAGMPPLLEFKAYACGSNGGPPLRPLTGWADFMLCSPEPDGLREVYFEYDDELEYVLRAMMDARVARFVGTQDRSFPVMASALFDEGGVLRGLRVVTDPRPDFTTDDFFDLTSLRAREDHYLYAGFVAGEFGMEPNRDCVTEPLAEGEQPVGGIWMKQRCEVINLDLGIYAIMAQDFYRKPGQQVRDPITGLLTIGQFQSTTSATMYQLGYGPTPTFAQTVGTAPAPAEPAPAPM